MVDEAWFDALTLQERIKSLDAAGLESLSQQPLTRIGRFRYEKWRKAGPLADPDLFAQRLTRDGLTEPLFVGLLNEPLAQLQSRTKQLDWVTTLQQLYAAGPCRLTLVSNTQNTRVHNSQLLLVKPLLSSVLCQLGAAYKIAADTIGRNLLPKKVLSRWVASLLDECEHMLTPVFVTELHSARFLKVLTGETPQDRFQSFLARFENPQGAFLLLRDYPVLGRMLLQFTSNWLAARVEFLQRLTADWSALNQRFLSTADAALTEIRDGLSDRHDEGRTVYVLCYDDGTRIVYKPKSLAVDQHFQNLLGWFNQHSDAHHPAQRLLTILNRPNYGWVEYVTRDSCETHAEAANYYVRLGSLLAILHLVRGTDFHSGNVIASGAQPMLIDLEGLFHPDLPYKADYLSSAEQEAHLRFYNSVISTLLLPNVRSNQYDDVADGGMGGAVARQALRLDVIDAGTDQMRFEQVWVPVVDEAEQNTPLVNNTAVNPLDFIAEIEHGFATTYRVAQRNQAALRREVSHFAGARVRFLFRDTMIYDKLLRQLLQPEQMRRGLSQERTLDLLWGRANQSDQYARLIADEKRELRAFDVPYFYTTTDSVDVWASNGRCFADVTQRSGLQTSLERIDALSTADCTEQLWYIRATLACGAQPNKTALPSNFAKSRQSPVELACEIGHRLAAQAIDDGDTLAWISLFSYRQHHYVGPNNLSIYSGSCGVALFFAALAHVTDDLHWERLARKTVALVQMNLRHIEEAQTGTAGTLLGLYDGVAGYLYTLAKLGHQFGDAQLVEQAHSWVGIANTMIDRDSRLNVLSGVAGLIPALHYLNAVAPDPVLLQSTIRAGDHLIKQLGLDKPVWEQPEMLRLGTGYAGGLIGISAELYRLSTWANAPHYATAASKILPHVKPIAAHADWGDGAIGQAAGWLSLPRDAMTEQGHVALEQAADIVLTSEPSSHALANGLMGTLDFLLSSAEMLNKPHLKNEAAHLAKKHLPPSLDSLRGGLPLDVQSVGLMHGLAGIGYGLLRYAEPTRIPSLLTIQPLTVKSGSSNKDQTHALPVLHAR